MSEVRGRSWEDPMPEGWRPRGITPRPRAGAAAESARLRRCRNGQEKPPRIRSQGRWLGGPTPSPRPGVAPEARGGGRKDQPHIEGVVAAWAQEGLEEPSHVERQEGRWEEIPLIQGKEQQLHFAGAAVNRYPTPR